MTIPKMPPLLARTVRGLAFLGAAVWALGMLCMILGLLSEYFAPVDPVGIMPNAGADGAKEWAVCVYDREAPGRWFIGTGGGAFCRIATKPPFTHRINAHSAAEAQRELQAFRALALREGRTVAAIGILDHSSPANPRVGTPLPPAFFDEVAKFRVPGMRQRLVFMGCSVGAGTRGAAFARKVADQTGFTVSAATHTANSEFGWASVAAVVGNGDPLILDPTVTGEMP